MPEGIQPEIVAHLKVGEGHVATPEEGSVARRGYPVQKTKSYHLNAAQRRLRMAAMCTDGMTLRAIADEEGVSHNYVADEINALIDDLTEQARSTMQVKVAREVLVLNMVQLEATIAWYESKEGKITNMKRRKKEVRSAFTHNTKKGRFNVVKTESSGLGMSGLDVQRKTRYGIAALFADTPSPNAPSPDIPVEAPEEEYQAPIIQLPVESEEEYERVEYTAGQVEFLRIILECVEKRARLQGLFKNDGDDGYDQVVNLTPEQRRDRLTALVQDIRAARAIVEGQNQLADGSQTPFVTPAPNRVIDVVAVPIPQAESSDSNGNGGPQ